VKTLGAYRGLSTSRFHGGQRLPLFRPINQFFDYWHWDYCSAYSIFLFYFYDKEDLLIDIDLGAMHDLDGVRYLPRQDGGVNGRVKGYAFYVSLDGVTWGSDL